VCSHAKCLHRLVDVLDQDAVDEAPQESQPEDAAQDGNAA
jgi:hypothetical protein